MELYSAGGFNTTPKPHDNGEPQLDLLRLSGYKFDEILELLDEDEITKPCTSGKGDLKTAAAASTSTTSRLTRSQAAWKAMLARQESLASTSPDPTPVARDTRWRTLLADQWPVGQRLRQEASFRGVPVPPASLCQEKELLFSDPPFEFPMLQGRRLMRTARGHWGLAPAESCVGDSLVVMPGGAVPYVVRARRAPSPGSESVEGEVLHRFIGEW